MSGGDSLSRGFPQRRHFVAAAAFFVLVAVYGSLVPWDYRPVSFADALAQFRDLALFDVRIASRADWAANVLLFVPIGFSAMATAIVDRGPRLWWSLASGMTIWIGCLALSGATEFSQLWFAARVASPYDIQAQSIGAIVGIVLAQAVAEPVVDWLRAVVPARGAASRLAWLLQIYVAGLIIYQVLPLDLTIHPREMWHKYKAGRIEIVPFASWTWDVKTLTDAAADIVLCVPLGAWCALGPLARRGRRDAWLLAVLIGTAVVALCELAQVFVYSRFSSSGDVLIGAVGVAIGASIATRFLRQGEYGGNAAPPTSGGVFWAATCGFAVVYTAYLFYAYCEPFDVLTDEQRIERRLDNFLCVPFSKLYWGTEFNAMTQMLGKFVNFLPLGIVAAVAIGRATNGPRLRRVAAGLFFAASAGLGCAIELAQVFFLPHYPDVTDVLFYTSGSVAGYFCGQYVFAGDAARGR